MSSWLSFFLLETLGTVADWSLWMRIPRWLDSLIVREASRGLLLTNVNKQTITTDTRMTPELIRIHLGQLGPLWCNKWSLYLPSSLFIWNLFSILVRGSTGSHVCPPLRSEHNWRPVLGEHGPALDTCQSNRSTGPLVHWSTQRSGGGWGDTGP